MCCPIVTKLCPESVIVGAMPARSCPMLANVCAESAEVAPNLSKLAHQITPRPTGLRTDTILFRNPFVETTSPPRR